MKITIKQIDEYKLQGQKIMALTLSCDYADALKAMKMHVPPAPASETGKKTKSKPAPAQPHSDYRVRIIVSPDYMLEVCGALGNDHPLDAPANVSISGEYAELVRCGQEVQFVVLE